MADTPRLGMPEISESQNSKYITHNEALRILDAMVQPVIIDKDLSAPPGSPSDGDIYIVGTTDSGSGDWNGHDDDIAYYKVSSWVFITPQNGFRVFVDDEGVEYIYAGSSGWLEALSNGYDIGFFVSGKPPGGETALYLPMVRSLNFIAGLTGSQVVCRVAPTSSAVFTFYKNDSSFGTATFAGGSNTAILASASGADFVAGDVLKVAAPGSSDATLEDIGITLKATRF